MNQGNALIIALILPAFLSSLAGCSEGDSPCSESNKCVEGYACNKDGECIPASGFQIITSALDPAYVGEPYETQLQASGGIPPYQWSVDSSLAWLSVERQSDDLWVLTGTPAVPTAIEGTDVVIISTDNSHGDGEEKRKTLPLIVFECVDGRKQNCFTPQGGVCVGGYETCTNNSWGVCDESTGPSIDIEYCGPTCEPCDMSSSDSCRGGTCACGNESPCTGGLICCHHKCMDVPECGDCGDDVKQDWEACEGNDFGQTTCESLGYAFGDLACTDRCIIDTSDCCGDGTTGTSEQCDDENTTSLDGCADCRISDFVLNSHTEGNQMGVSLASHTTGDFTAVWISDGQDGSGMGVFGQRFDSTGYKIGNEFRINTYTDGHQYSPRVPKGILGDFVVAWTSEDQGGSSFGVYAQRIDSSGNLLGSEFLVNTSTDSAQSLPSVAMQPNLGFVVTWNGYVEPTGDLEIFSQLFDTDGNPVGGEYRVTNDIDNDQGGPVVASDASGNFAIVWQRSPRTGSDVEIVGQRFDSSGNPVGSEFSINIFSDGIQSEPDIAMDSTGKFVVVWMSYAQDGSEYGVFGRLYGSNGTPITGEFQVNTYTESDQFFPDVSMDEAGNFIVTWSSIGQDSGVEGIFAQKFDSSGQPQGEEFQLNSPQQSSFAPSVAMFGQGRFVAAWDSAYLSINDVVGQRFNDQGEPRGREPW